MSKKKSRARNKNKANGPATGQEVKPADGTVPPVAGSGAPPLGLHFSGPTRPPEGFHTGPPGFRAPLRPTIQGDPELMMRESQMRGPGFHPGEFGGHPRFPYPQMDGRPPNFQHGPPGFQGERFVPPHLRDRPPGFVPPEFRGGPPGFVPPEFRGGPPGFVPPEFRVGPPGFVPPEFRAGPPGFIRPEFREGPPGFIPPEFGSGPPGFIPPEFRDISQPGHPEMGSSQGPVVNCGSTDPSTSTHLPQSQGNTLVQTTSGTDQTNETKTGKTKTKALSAISKGPVIRSMVDPAKPPAGRSVGVITFIGPDYGVIEREDTKTYRFSFEAFFGNRKHLLPDVKVHFTAVKVMGNECAADVKVAPGGTEHIDTTVYEGVVTKVIPDTYVLEPRPGRIRTILVDEPVKLPFGKMDTRATLLLFDRVKFQVLGDLVTQMKTATNITPQMPETIQLTKEVRLTGVIVSINDETCIIMSKKNKEYTGSVKEHLSDGVLKVMDEVEFTTKTVNAGRVGKVNTVQAIRIKKLQTPEEADEIKSKWKPVVSKDTGKEVKVDFISSDTYDGTVLKAIQKKSPQGVKQPLQGLVKFTVDGTEKRLPFGSDGVITRATMLIGDVVRFNIATNQQTKENRAVNVTIQLDSFRTQLMEKRKCGVILKLNESNGTIRTPQESLVVFNSSEIMDSKLTVSEKAEFTLVVSAEGKRAIRITRPNAPEPEAEEKKEKNKIQMDLKEPIKNEVRDPENKDGPTIKPETDGKPMEDQGRSRSQERSRRRRSRSRESGYRRRRSSSRDRSYRSHRRSRSRSRDRYARSDQRRSRSPDYRGEHHRRRSRSPDLNTKGLDSQIAEELVKKREELLELNELIARKKAIIAMEQTNLFIDAPEELIYEYQNQRIPDVKRVKSILKRPADPCASFQHQKIKEGSSSTIELVEYPKITPSVYTLASSEAHWKKQSSSPENEDPELARKKRQLQELNESIARKRAIIAMEQKAKVTKKEYDPPSFLSHYDEDPTDESTWDPDIRSENTWDLNIKPKKSILKKRSEDPPQREMTSTNRFDRGQDLFKGSKSPPDDRSASSSPSSLPSMPTNTFNYFKSLIDAVSAGSRTSKSSHVIETSDLQPMPSTSQSQTPPFSQQGYSQASATKGPPVQTSAAKQKSNLSKQMERFLGALNKADSSMLSSLLEESNSDSKDLKNRRNQQHKKEPRKEELYDPFSETNDNEDSPFMGSKGCKIPMLGNFKDLMGDYGQEDLLPHERAVEDGSGFSRIVGMTYGTDSNPENQKSNRFYTDDPFLQVHVSYPEDGRRYDEGKESKTLVVQRRFSPLSQKSERTSEEVDDGAGQYKKLQDLLQTIGLNLDTTEVTQLADRTRERLYGKKANPQTTPSDSVHQKDKRSSWNDRRASQQSNDSDAGACSSSPAKSSKREVYMSYSHLDKAAGKERDLVSLTRTIRNSPEDGQASPDSSRVNEETNRYNPVPPLSSLYQSAASQYSQPATEPISADQYHNVHQASWGSSYTLPSDQTQTPAHTTPYDAQPPSPYYAPSYPPQHYYPPPGYGTYTPLVSPLPMANQSPAPLFPPPTFAVPGPFGSFSNSSYPPFTESSGFPAQQIKVKSTPTTRCLKTIETQNHVQVKKTTESASIINVQTNAALPEGDESEAVSTSEDAIKGKLKKRLEQFNQRMRLKKKLKMEAQRTHGQSQQSTPGQVTETEVKNVWICGHSLVFWAKKRATSPEVGMQLGMDRNTVRIWWKGVQGMKWQQLLPQLLQLKGNWAKPDVILIHLGGNDIGTSSPDAFVEAVKNDLVSLKSVFPQCLLVWSDILPRKSWRHSENSLEVNDVRDAINQQVHGVMEELGGSSLTHENITPTLDSCLYRPDGVHLSGRGIDTFNLNMQDFLEKWESKISETESAEA